MEPNQAILLVLGLSLSAAAFFFLLIVLKNRRWYLHVVHFVAGVVAVLGGLASLAILATAAYFVVRYFMLAWGGIYLVAGLLALAALVIGAPLASTALADVLERNGYRVGKRTYLILLLVGVPVVPIAAFFGAFAAIGQRMLRRKYQINVEPAAQTSQEQV